MSGNRTLRKEGEKQEEYHYDSRNRLKELLFYDSKEQGKETYTYDAQGNLLQTKIEGFREKESYQKRETYQYNAFQQAIRVERTEGIIGSPVSIIQENSYDAEGMRYAIRENGKQTTFQTNGWNILEEESEEGGKYRYYHRNEHGDIELLTEETGRITNRYQYEAFGGLIEAEEKERNRFRYSGEVEDELTGQYYLRARYYCPRLGRFTQEDNYRGDGLNLYAYCMNNPVFYINPSGYTSINPNTGCLEEADESKKEVSDELEEDTQATVRVGRWMSEDEYNKMKKTQRVQKPYDADQSYVANPASYDAFYKQAEKGSFYVEFDVPISSLRQTKDVWATIPGPNSVYSKLLEKKGEPPIKEFPRATNIEKKGVKN